MKYDFHASHPVSRENLEDCIKGVGLFQGFAADARIRLLAQAMRDAKLKAQGTESLSRTLASEGFIASRLKQMRSLGLYVPSLDMASLPAGSWAIQFTFQLAKPYISRDDNAFYIVDNPLKKEKVFGVPYVSPSSWKGSLRAALRTRNGWTDRDEEMVVLFGNPRAAAQDFRAGRLLFFPTYLNMMDLEVINPHNRTRGAGNLPIYLESARRGAKGTFILLYVPFDQVGEDTAAVVGEASRFLDTVSQGVADMLTVYGFGAKTSSGYGTAEDCLPQHDGRILFGGEVHQFLTISELRTVAGKIRKS